MAGRDVRFLGMDSLAFSGMQHAVRGPCCVVCDRALFFENNTFASKMGKMDQKRVKNSLKKVFYIIGKFSS